jgi:hypothetical protein
VRFIVNAENIAKANGAEVKLRSSTLQGNRSAAHLDPLAVYEDSLHGEVDADGVAMALDERAGPEALHHAGLARAAIADQHDLKQVVEGLVVARAYHQVVGIAARHSHRGTRVVRSEGDGRVDFVTLLENYLRHRRVHESSFIQLRPFWSISHSPTAIRFSGESRDCRPPFFPSSSYYFQFLFFAQLFLSLRINHLFSLFERILYIFI